MMFRFMASSLSAGLLLIVSSFAFSHAEHHHHYEQDSKHISEPQAIALLRKQQEGEVVRITKFSDKNCDLNYRIRLLSDGHIQTFNVNACDSSIRKR